MSGYTPSLTHSLVHGRGLESALSQKGTSLHLNTHQYSTTCPATVVPFAATGPEYVLKLLTMVYVVGDTCGRGGACHCPEHL